MDQLRALRYFASVADTSSFSRSAERFRVPPSSLSRRIADLEAHLGATLLNRTTRSVSLTEVGRQYAKQIQPLLQNLAEADDAVRSYSKEPMGTLRISSMVSFGEHKLRPVLKDFSARYPKIVLDVHLTDTVTTLDKDHIDLAIRGGYVPNERIVAKRLMGNDFVPLAAPSYLQRHGTPTTALELRQHRGLYFRTPAGPTPWLAKIDEQWQNVSGPAVMTTNDGPWLREQAVNGGGIIFMPKWVCEEEIERGQLIELTLDAPTRITPDNQFAVYLLYQTHRYSIPKIKVAVDYLLERLTE
ncbi:LysR family transcriptional regulator [Reinekea blandensis]|uniref:Putative transcriptional regulatory protein (LysR family) n=1 Tax=Reinekea blandensis MED297 TaxID=314283 RepID=A4BDE3_9GAMM|nr:LysR family transcriptional regulator [Reinekea blandensis]EAR09887.1 putative transcriptional regulatory protein (LysR family) [Reinekea sp. MED297] [Reinekea blandensis MED297]